MTQLQKNQNLKVPLKLIVWLFSAEAALRQILLESWFRFRVCISSFKNLKTNVVSELKKI